MFWDFTFVSYSDIEPNIIFFFLRSLIIELLPLYIIFFEGHSIVYNCYNFVSFSQLQAKMLIYVP